MKWTLCLLLCVLVGLTGCSDHDSSDSGQTPLPDAEPAVLALTSPAPEAFDPPKANEIVFDMAYRGLDPDHKFYFQYGYGYGSGDEDTPFIEDLKRHGIKNLRMVHNYEFEGAQTSALEIRDKKPVAFYIDLDANGKVTSNERILPLPAKEDESQQTHFLTPDFSFKNRDGQQVCFRTVLNVHTYSGQDQVNWHWTPACVLEGQAQVGDEQARLLLYPSGMSGVFDKFGWADGSLQIGETQLTSRPKRDDLSPLWHANGRFYRLEIEHAKDNATALRVILAEDTSPTGQVEALLTFKEKATGEIQHARISGAKREDNISLALPQTTMALPIVAYRLDRGRLNYGVDENNQWQVDFSGGPEISIKQDIKNAVSLGTPTLALHAIDIKNRYKPNAQMQTTYKQGTRIYLDRKVTGQAGESYGRFQEIKDHRRDDIMAHIAITNANGKQILSKDLEYG